MSIEEAIAQIRNPRILMDDRKLKAILSAIFEAGKTNALEELRRDVSENGPDILLDHRIDIFANRHHGLIMFSDGIVEPI